MRRIALVAVALGALAVPAQVSALDTGIRGRVIDETCYGPCSPGTNPRPFAGEADIIVRSLPDREIVARVPVVESRFRVGLAPGSYRVRVIPYPDEPQLNCWEGSRRRVRVDKGEVERIKLTVVNGCVLSPQ